MKISFAHHLSLSYGGGGEKWVAELAVELARRGHDVSIYALPLSMKGTRNKIPPLENVEYKEGWRHKIDADVTYITYHPFNWLNFNVTGKIIGGIHSHCYWQPFAWKYGLLPNLANFVNAIFSRRELGRFNALHTVTPIYPLNHKKVYFIPNFVSEEKYYPSAPKYEAFTVGYASRKVWQKGYDVFTQLKKELPDINFTETGNIPEGKMMDFHSRNHVTVVPARVDTFGLVNVESLLCGTPVISSGLPTHKALSLPLFYASTFEEYKKIILNLQDEREGAYAEPPNFKTPQTQFYRDSALKYGKKAVVDQLENMFESVLYD